jgi:uncharacterized membrane protein
MLAMTLFRVRTVLDKAFAIGLCLKAIDGLSEVVGGLWLLLLDPARLQVWAGLVFTPELREDPHDFIATHVLQGAAHFNQGTIRFAAIYLLSHGIAKLVVIGEILRGRLWAYPGLIAITTLFAFYQIYHMVVAGSSLGYLALTLFDGLIIALTIAEYAKIRSR